MVAAMVLDHRFTDDIAFGLFATFPSCVVKLAVHPLKCSIGLNDCQARESLAPFGPKTLENINGATVVLLACVVVNHPLACAKLLSFPRTGALILRDLSSNNVWGYITPENHLSEWSTRILDILWEGDISTSMKTWARSCSQLVASYVGRDTGSLYWWNNKVLSHPETLEPFPTAAVLCDALAHGQLLLPKRSGGAMEYLQNLALAAACTFGAVLSIVEAEIQKRERRTQNIQSLSAVAIEWGANFLRFVAIGGLSSLQVDLDATKGFFDKWLDDKQDAYASKMKEGLMDLWSQLQLLLETAFADAGQWDGSELDRKRCTAVALSFQTCFNKNLLLCLKSADPSDFQIQIDAFNSNSGLLDLLRNDRHYRDWLEPLLIRIHATVFVSKTAPMRRPDGKYPVTTHSGWSTSEQCFDNPLASHGMVTYWEPSATLEKRPNSTHVPTSWGWRTRRARKLLQASSVCFQLGSCTVDTDNV